MSYQTPQKRYTATARIVVIYALFGLAWIYGSDTLLGWLVNDPSIMVKIAVIKGSLFILFTASLLFILISRFARKLATAEISQIESLKNYQAIFNATNEAIFVHDAQSGRIVDVNDRMLEIYGYTRDEALTADIGRMSVGIHPYSQEEAVENVRKAMNEGPQVFEWLSRKKTGDLFWSEVSLKRFTTTGYDRIIAVVRDISDRKQAEDAQQKNEATHRIIVNSAMDGFLMVSPQGGILEANEAYCQMSGYTMHELLHMRIDDLDVNESNADAIAHNQKIKDQEKDRFLSQHRRKDGTHFDVEVSAMNIPVDGGLFVGFVRDITESKKAEESLRLFMKTVNNSSDAIGMATPDGKHFYQNEAFDRMFGHIGAKPADIYVDKNVFNDVLTTVTAGGQWSGEVKMFGKNNRLLDIYFRGYANKDSSGKIIGLVGIHTDITERKKSEDELREAQELFSLFMKYSPIYAYIKKIEGDQSRIIQLSDNFINMVGIPAQELRGRTMSEVFPEDFARKITEDDITVVNQGKVIQLEEELNGRKYLTIKFPIIREGRNHFLAGFTIDVTDRKRAEEDRFELEKQLLHAQKLESLGILAGGIAHDFNNLLAAILGNLDLAMLRLPPGSPVANNIEQSMQASRRAADLTRQMLAYAGKGMFLLRPVDLNEIVTGNTDLFRTVIPRNITLNVHTESDLPQTLADPGQVQQVVMNLITNAAEAISAESGIISLATGCADCGRSYIQLSVLEEKPVPGRFVYVEVSDNGSGMNEETKRRLFDPFFTTKFTGRGLGMAATQGIVRSHNGLIILDSVEGEGTTFRVLFPVIAASVLNSEQESPTPEQPIAVTGKKGKILIVDDEDIVRTMGVEFAEYFGYETIEACNGAEAVEIYRQQSREIAVVILDLTMPVMDGVATFKELKMINPNGHVILSSGFSEQSAIEQFPNERPDAFMQKPFQAKEFEQKIKQIFS